MHQRVADPGCTAQGTGVDSFNVSVAAGIILYEIQSQRAAE